MGREIRMVPAGWQHPRGEDGRYIPLFDQTYVEAMKEWNERTGLALLDTIPPREDDYRSAFKAPADHFQAYQHTTEGSPVSPPFRTPVELVDWIAEYGLDQDYEYGRMKVDPIIRPHAASFVVNELVMILCRSRVRKDIVERIRGKARWYAVVNRDGTTSKGFNEEADKEWLAYADALRHARWVLECNGLPSIHACRERPDTLLAPIYQMFFDEGIIDPG